MIHGHHISGYDFLIEEILGVAKQLRVRIVVQADATHRGRGKGVPADLALNLEKLDPLDRRCASSRLIPRTNQVLDGPAEVRAIVHSGNVGVWQREARYLEVSLLV